MNKIRSYLSNQEILVVCQSGDTFLPDFFLWIETKCHSKNSYRGIIVIHEERNIPVVFFCNSHDIPFSEWNRLPFQHYVREDQLRYSDDKHWIYWNAEECGYTPSTREFPWEKREVVERLILPIIQPNHHYKGHPTNENPIVTIGIATYQMGHMLMWAVQSVKNQTNPHWHLLVYDDGSTDSTTNILQNEVHDPRITVLRGKENKGKAYALNQILNHTCTPWLMELDADDWLSPHAVQSIYEATDAIGEDHIQFIYGNYYLWEQGKRGPRYRGIQSPKWDQLERFIQSGTVICPRVYSTDALFQIGGWDEGGLYKGRLYEDLELLYRLKMKDVSVILLPSPIYHRRLHSLSITHQAKKNAYPKWLIDLKSKSST
ncbi:glycosyltransferase family 2 protein [Thermoactinomyces sp. DSM 45892]|uniref:glycosyltransferase family 2 protein n=1 Tax=Thermoactinomyces sp. DSM 45892 TaxID=1882753 RepID=UPI000899D9F7|nr:glycosyltransferase family 2 protein [Thermoactinomyces sp. DSM 45892]SDY52237.1 Glycosyltransferase involved in cell wall bisynthesis [Thermoactinomyces sp. DSM 45892]